MAKWRMWFTVVVFYSAVFTPKCAASLVVNVKTKGGDITQQEFESFPNKDLVTLGFKLNDWRYIDIALDFKKNLQIFKAIILGEMDKAESPYEMACFAVKMTDGEYISSDAMSKLRQKNPDAIRSPEEDVGSDELVLDHLVSISKPGLLTDPVQKLCEEVGQVYTTGDDVKSLLSDNSTFIDLSVQNLSSTIRTKRRCHETKENNESCICRLDICISWYPCDLKYCQGQDSDGQPTEYRCGIKTCGKCRDFDYLVNNKQHCFWDDNPRS